MPYARAYLNWEEVGSDRRRLSSGRAVWALRKGADGFLVGSRNGLDLLKGGFVFLGTLQTGFELGLSTWVIGDVTGVEEKVGGD
jgi:hypothetical protein